MFQFTEVFFLVILFFKLFFFVSNFDHISPEEKLFEELWENYETCGPTPRLVRNLFIEGGNEVKNDHVAFRTYNLEKVNLDQLAKFFIEVGYKESGSYIFEEKKLFAKHFEKEGYPKVFISELRVELLSEKAQEIIKELVEKVDEGSIKQPAFLVSGRYWDVNYEVYKKLLDESEYAAWLYSMGFRVNHFTVSVNELEKFEELEEVNDFLKSNGIILNSAGGEIKGSKEIFLEQSSTMADVIPIEFQEGSFDVRSCYYEFAKRYPENGEEGGRLFSGFRAKSADKIFESTDVKENTDEL